MTSQPARYAVIGAGIAGLACARTLLDAGATVTVFEKEETAGGRAATLIGDTGPFDHGAQYFTTEQERFTSVARRWQADGVVAPWRGRIMAYNNGKIEDKSNSTERLVPVPGMRRLGIYLAQGLAVRYSTSIARLRREGESWYLHGTSADAAPTGPFDAVCVTAPSEVSADLLRDHTPMVDQVKTVHWDPCWSVVMALSQKSGAEFDGAFVNDDPILGWAALDSSKPRRGTVEGVAERWVLHARPGWSRRYSDMEPPQVARWLARSFSAKLRRSLTPLQLRAFFWPFATPLNPLPQLFLWDRKRGLGMAGDWCGGPRVEGAYLSGLALAEAVLG